LCDASPSTSGAIAFGAKLPSAAALLPSNWNGCARGRDLSVVRGKTAASRRDTAGNSKPSPDALTTLANASPCPGRAPGGVAMAIDGLTGSFEEAHVSGGRVAMP
jgi:hypothetical protein